MADESFILAALTRIELAQVDKAASLARIEADVHSLRGELLGNGQPGRVQRLEEDFESYKNKQWMHSMIVVPVFTILHALANKLGIRI